MKETQTYAASSDFTGCSTATAADVKESCAAPAEVASVISDIKAETTGFETAKTELANFVTDNNAYRAYCYGPQWKDNAPAGGGASTTWTERPSGDTGMVATDLTSTDTTACSVGQMQALLAGYPSFANDVLKFKTLLNTALKGAGSDIVNISVGQTLNGASHLPSITGVVVSVATVTRYNDSSDGARIYYTTIRGTDNAGKDFDAYIYDKVFSLDSDKLNSGVMKAVFPNGSSGNTLLSMVYNTANDGTLTYELRTAQNSTSDGAGGENGFAGDGEIDFSLSAFNSNGNIIRASMNTNTNAATMHYAWQAGRNDGAARVFAINIPAGASGSLTGVAYAGYGASIGSLAANPGGDSIWATKFHCNWTSGLGNGQSVARIQKQTIAQNAVGTFVNSGTAQINFAPTDSCTINTTYTIATSAIGAGAATTYNGTRSAVTTSSADYLTTYGSDVPAITVTNPWDGSSLPTN